MIETALIVHSTDPIGEELYYTLEDVLREHGLTLHDIKESE
jgi:hypothetical protein